MRKKLTFWALKDPKGKIIPSTVERSKDECWEQGFWVVCEDQGENWRQKYWKKLSGSIHNAEKLGYKFCRVEIKEITR